MFVIVPALVGVATIVTVACAPAASAPMAQVTVPEALVAAVPLETAESKVTSLGSVSETVTPAAALGPLFVTVNV